MAVFLGLLLAGCAFGLAISLLVGRILHRRILRLQNGIKESQRLAELGTLTGGLAHEIKNPLSTVQLNLQLLEEEIAATVPGASRVLNRLKVAQRETSRLRETLDDFLRYAGRLELQRHPTDLNQVIEELVDFFSAQASQTKVQIRQKPVPPEHSDVIADVDDRLIKQALLNLMLNATQAMPSGGELILSAGRDGDDATIEVVDTGMGIKPESLANIFDAYYSTKGGGTGLGLAMTRRIILEHGGTIDVQSEVGKGSKFTIHLPMKINASSNGKTPA